MARVEPDPKRFPPGLGSKDFDVEDILEANAYGVAFRASLKGSDTRVVLKLCFPVNSTKEIDEPVPFQREFNVLTNQLSSSHPNVERVLDSFVGPATEQMVAAIKVHSPSLANKFQRVNPRTGLKRSICFRFFVTELNPTLSSVIFARLDKRPDHLPAEFVARVALGVAEALHFAESHRTVHLSVVLENVAVTLDSKGMPDRVMLGNWGHSVVVPGPGPLVRTFYDTLHSGLRNNTFRLASEIIETMAEMRIEASRGGGRPMAVDFSYQSPYSIGSLLVRLMFAAVPICCNEPPASFPKKLRDIMDRAIDPNPKRRPTLVDIIHRLRELTKPSKGASTKKTTDAATTLGGGGGGGCIEV